ncbi:PMD domain-containing protein [Citrus sinensis]|nr:PMD domain-containing protein [Citrus sinensis]
MEEPLDDGFEVREEMMVSLTGGGNPTERVAHFLKHNINSIHGPVFELPSHCLNTIPKTFAPRNWPLDVKFHGWRLPQRKWQAWVGKMAALHESTWKKAGIHEAILNSKYAIRKNNDLVLGLAEKWCPETKSFIFPWGEATITLEDMMIPGYSVLGSPVFRPLQTDELKEIEKKLNQVRKKLDRSTHGKAEHSAWMNEFMDSGSKIEHEAFLALWLSRYVFPSSFCIVVKSIFPLAVHLARGTRIALAPALLASIYRDLNLLKENIVALIEIDHWEDDDSKLSVTLRSPFQLVQIWAWERFIDLRPKPNLINSGEPRFAQWHNKMSRFENVRRVLDSAKENFDWRPYAKILRNWKLPEFYGEREMWVAVDAGLSQELWSLTQILRVSELVGLDCVEQYHPHRVAMQFGMDQDLPALVDRANKTPCVAWSDYCKPISYAKLYVPSRLYEADVTTRYLDWWKQSLSRLQVASRAVLPRLHIFSTSEINPKRSKRVKRSFAGSRRMLERVQTMKKIDRLDKMKEGDGSLIHASFSCKGLENSPLLTLNIKKELSDASASIGFHSQILPLSLRLMKEADNSHVPPGFPPKSNLVKRDSAEEDNLAIKESLKFSEKQNDIQNTREIIMQNESTDVVSVTDTEDVKSRARDHVTEGNGENYASEVPEDLEAWVSRLERIVEELKAARFGYKRPG